MAHKIGWFNKEALKIVCALHQQSFCRLERDATKVGQKN